MTDKAQVSSKASFTGSRVTIHTGHGIVNSTKYEKVEVAPGITQVHVALPATANTVSLWAASTPIATSGFNRCSHYLMR